MLRSCKSLRIQDVVTGLVGFKATEDLTVLCGFHCPASQRHSLTVERLSRAVISGVSFG
jgi:hypothetical protein